MRTAIDTNVFSLMWTGGPQALGVAGVLQAFGEEGGLVISAPVFAELMAYPTMTPDTLDRFLGDEHIEADFDLGEDVWREAGGRFAAYSERRRRSKGGVARRLLADFVIGAHALVRADRLLTFDARRYAKDFPELEIAVPIALK